ncbi:MAG: fibrillarin-like rRNA/tRNA 2'-O-methyltransferase [Candidatus Woesearchaeota archaeon]|nr:fibrillarin-like rRNA/tRNA 2'-O-methyltransferase [Candidatus Woesearchaeota archaeon]
MIIPHRLQGVFKENYHLFTQNLVPGVAVYGERLVNHSGIEYREWDVRRSKIGAAIIKEVSQIGIKPGVRVLYLGCASGTTASHVSDIVGKSGFVFALDVAPRPLRDMVLVAEQRENMTVLLADANHPEQYWNKILECDAVFQDIAQKNQVEIFLKNCRMFLKKGGCGILAVKARSIAVQERPSVIFAKVRAELEKEMTIVDYRALDPFEKDHAFFVVKMKE